MKHIIYKVLSVLLVLTVMVGCTTNKPTETDELSLKDDFYEAVNEEWLATAQIPSDSPYVGGFSEISDGIDDLLRSDFDEMLTNRQETESAGLTNFLDYYAMALDQEKRNEEGITPLLPYIEKIESLSSVDDFISQLADWDLDGMPSPVVFALMADMKNTSEYGLYAATPGMFLMDKSYYAEENAYKPMMQQSFKSMVVNLLVLTGKTEEEAIQIAEEAMVYDELIATYAKSAEESSDIPSMYNPIDINTLDSYSNNLKFSTVIQQLLGEVPNEVIVINTDYYEAIDEFVNEENFSEMKSWMIVQTVTNLAPYLNDEMRLESGSFMRMMSGVTESSSFEESAYYLANPMFAEVVGDYYGRTYFGEEAKQDVKNMVENILAAYKHRLENNEWLSDTTKEMAIKKLDTMVINVGYPDQIDSIYDQFVVNSDVSLLENYFAISRVFKEYYYSFWNKEVDRTEWPLSADTVNAMYSPLNNSINFPAAILQAPFYSLEQSTSTNYGGIGAVIAHEISHAFDPNGSQFDEYGNLNNWWTEEDYAKFEELSQLMVEQFDGLEYAGGEVNGVLTVTENVADAGGLQCAMEALQMESEINLEEFFKSWAIIWRMKATQQYESLLLTLDVHAPNKLRANVQLKNIDEFYEIFDIKEGDGMYLEPEKRITIW